MSAGVSDPIRLSPIAGSTWVRSALSSRARVDARLAGLHSNHSSASLRNVTDPPRGSTHELRTECSRPGTSWSSYAYVGNNTFTPIKADGYNTIGWQDFGNPPPDGDSTCQGDMFANRFFYIGYACPFVDGSGREYEYGVALDAGDGWTTDLNNTSTNNVQVVSTHEYGHVSGLAHPDDGDCSSTAHNARLTMYRCLFPGSDQYTLGAGDMNGFLVKRP